MISVHFQGKPCNITVIQVYALTSNAEEAEIEQFYEDIEDLLELTPKEDILFTISSVQSLSHVRLFAEYIMRNTGLEKGQAGLRLPGEISITSDMQMTPPLWQKVKRN